MRKKHSMYGERGRVCKSDTKTSRRRKYFGMRELTWVYTYYYISSDFKILYTTVYKWRNLLDFFKLPIKRLIQMRAVL